MAVFLHFAPAIGLAATAGRRFISPRLMLAGAACAVLPDVDFLIMKIGGFPYGHIYGHRGFTHSIGFAILLAVLAWLWAVPWRRQAQQTWKMRWADRAVAGGFILLCTLSHPLLDNLINAGICTAWLWPLDDARTCLPWRPISVSGMRMFTVDWFWVEAKWIGLPLLAVAAVARLWRRAVRRMKQRGGVPGTDASRRSSSASTSSYRGRKGDLRSDTQGDDGVRVVRVSHGDEEPVGGEASGGVRAQAVKRGVLSARAQHQIRTNQEAETVLLRMRLQAIEASGLGMASGSPLDIGAANRGANASPRAQRQKRRLALEAFARSLVHAGQWHR